MKKVILSLLCACAVSLSAVCGQSNTDIIKETFLYSVKGSDSLYLDRYFSPAVPGPKPCVIFVFGGGFAGGNRDNEGYMPFFGYLAAQGYAVVSIDYRLGMKNAGQQGSSARDFLKLFVNAIDMAVEDLFDATSYVVENARAWGVDKDRIVMSGSSAGAITALMGEYAICNGDPQVRKLPEGFNYEGVVAFAGAIFSTGRPAGFENSCPVMMFHGDADSNVPYDRITKLGVGLYGSAYIAAQLDKANVPYWFHTAENAAHEMAVIPMDDNREEIRTFLEEFVDGGVLKTVNTRVREMDKPEVGKKFKLMDYIRANF